jgi:cell division septum initiation protein DivIVA
MTKKELRKLNRYQLLELLVMQTEQNQQLQQQVEQLQTQLQERHLQMERLGSIAEAALQLQGVFEAAQKAADDYLAAAQLQAQKMIEDAQGGQKKGAPHES